MTSSAFDLQMRQGWRAPRQAEDGVYYPDDFGGKSISYPVDGLDLLGHSGSDGWWFDHRAEVVSAVTENLGITELWEVGAGPGSMAVRLSSTFERIVVVEPYAQGARASADKGLTSICGTLEDLELPDSSLPNVGLFDVIEHLEDEEILLREVRRVLIPGGFVVVTVPAFRLLWGEEDDFAGHFRRYTSKSLVRLFTRLGFETISTRYLFMSLAPAALVLRALPYRLGKRRGRELLLEHMENHLYRPGVSGRLICRVLRLELAFSRIVNLPVGLSLIGVFRAR